MHRLALALTLALALLLPAAGSAAAPTMPARAFQTAGGVRLYVAPPADTTTILVRHSRFDDEPGRFAVGEPILVSAIPGYPLLIDAGGADGAILASAQALVPFEHVVYLPEVQQP
jgi:hypothetical protein